MSTSSYFRLFQSFSYPLLRRQGRDLLGPHDRRRIPFSSKRFDFGAYRRMAEVEGPFGSRKPIGLLFRTRALVLKIKIERPVRIVLEWHPAADGETVQVVGDLKALPVVECDLDEKAFTGGMDPLSKRQNPKQQIVLAASSGIASFRLPQKRKISG